MREPYLNPCCWRFLSLSRNSDSHFSTVIVVIYNYKFNAKSINILGVKMTYDWWKQLYYWDAYGIEHIGYLVRKRTQSIQQHILSRSHQIHNDMLYYLNNVLNTVDYSWHRIALLYILLNRIIKYCLLK